MEHKGEVIDGCYERRYSIAGSWVYVHLDADGGTRLLCAVLGAGCVHSACGWECQVARCSVRGEV